MALQLIPKRRTLPNPSLLHLFSTNAADEPKSSWSDCFSDIKSKLDQHGSSSSSSPSIRRFVRSSQSSEPTELHSNDEIRATLSQFRRRNVSEGGDGGGAGQLSFAPIYDSIKKLKPESLERNQAPPSSFTAIRRKLGMSHPDGHTSPAPEGFPESVFGKEMREREGGGDDGATAAMKTFFVRNYSYLELGEKLKNLRPVEKKKKEEGWFSIEELNLRLEKLREMDSKKNVPSSRYEYEHIKSAIHSIDNDKKRNPSK